MLHVADLRALAKIAHDHNTLLLVDNTLASPVLCRPLTLGADLVVESITKIMNGHSDVILGCLCGMRFFLGTCCTCGQQPGDSLPVRSNAGWGCEVWRH